MQGLDHGREHEPHGTAGTADEDVADAGVLIVQGVKAQLVGTDDPCSRTEGEPHSPAGLILADVVADDAVAAVGSHRQGAVQDYRRPGLRGPEAIALLPQPVEQGAEGLDRGVDDAFVNIANHGCSSTVVS